MGNADFARYHLNVLEFAHRYVDIYVFCEHEHNRAFAYFLSLINQHPQGVAILERTHFIDSRTLMRWTRDYGPIFGIGRDKQLVAFDFVYRNLFQGLEGTALHADDPHREFLTLQGDAMPAYVVATLQTDFDSTVDIVRPPVSMDGGDFVSDGDGNIFVSTQTLARNGGNKGELESLFQRYFGAKKLHVLEALPGATVRHLDMILKFLDFKTLLVPEYQEPLEPEVNPYQVEMNRKVRSVLEKNERYLRKHFPDYRIIKAPMPPILHSSRSDIVAKSKQEFVKVVALERELRSAETLESMTTGELVELEKQVLRVIRAETPGASLQTDESFDRLLRSYGQMPLETVIDLYAESVARYRSYINSVFLHSNDGRRAFLVPRFTSSDQEEAAALKRWETKTESAYRSAWPDAKIHWVNCDSMVSDMGFLHCSTITVPSLTFN